MTYTHPFSESGDTISIFPLPTTVFYPQTILPLHIFEPRYRQMIADALEGDLKIGMVLLKPGWEANYYHNPDIVSIGCVGTIDRHVRLPDGKYNLALTGLSRFRIKQEVSGKAYRRAEIELLQEINNAKLEEGRTAELISSCREYLNLLPEDHEHKSQLNPEVFQTLAHLTDEIGYRLDISVESKQALLEEQNVLQRTRLITNELAIKTRLLKHSRIQTQTGFDVRTN